MPRAKGSNSHDGVGAAPLQSRQVTKYAAATTTAAPSAAPAGQSKSQPGLPPRVETVTVPVPVTFVFNEATLTSDGERAARLLLDRMPYPLLRLLDREGYRHEEQVGEDAVEVLITRP